MARQAEAEREKRAKIIATEGEAPAADALGSAADIMLALALQLRNLQCLVEIGVDRNTTMVFTAPLMSTIGELRPHLARETAATLSTVVILQIAPLTRHRTEHGLRRRPHTTATRVRAASRRPTGSGPAPDAGHEPMLPPTISTT
jgi:hypothetical protein